MIEGHNPALLLRQGQGVRAITQVAPEPGLLPISCGEREPFPLRQAEVPTQANGNVAEPIRSGGLNQVKSFPMPGSGERVRYAARYQHGYPRDQGALQPRAG